MSQFRIKVYLIYKEISNFVKLLKFMFYLYRTRTFCENASVSILKVIQKFIELKQEEFSNVALNRTSEQSYRLLSVLTNEYIETKSETTLNQLLEVLKVEFIRRKQIV